MARSLNVEADKARDFAKTYVNLVEALLQQGVDEDTARSEARITALTILGVADAVQPSAACPVCGTKR